MWYKINIIIQGQELKNKKKIERIVYFYQVFLFKVF
jgi:hypothetical protein